MENMQISSFKYDPNSLLKIYCFGMFRVLRPGENEPIGALSTHKLWRLFKYLLVNRRAAVPTAKLIEDLWPDQGDPDDTTALRTTVCRLNAMLKTKNSAKSPYSYIISKKDSCAFNLKAPYWLDIEVFERLCATKNGKLCNSCCWDCPSNKWKRSGKNHTFGLLMSWKRLQPNGKKSVGRSGGKHGIYRTGVSINAA
jgi:hypothetical protein